MEVLTFYWPNMLAASLLVIILSLFGQHLMARNQTMDVMLLGQEFQTGILFGVVFLSFFTATDAHGYHFEEILSLLFALISHFTYLKLTKFSRSYRIEAAVVWIVLLMSLSHFIVSLSPLVEFHMVKSAIGDVVTVSKIESFVSIGIFIIIGMVYYYYRKVFFNLTLEISLFNRAIKRKKSLIFNILLYVLMFVSIHLFGVLFTLGAMLIPSFLSAVLNLSRQRYKFLIVLNTLITVLSFLMISHFERIPTTVLIVFGIFFMTLIFNLFIHNLKKA